MNFFLLYNLRRATWTILLGIVMSSSLSPPEPSSASSACLHSYSTQLLHSLLCLHFLLILPFFLFPCRQFFFSISSNFSSFPTLSLPFYPSDVPSSELLIKSIFSILFQLFMIDNCADDWRIAMTWQRMMQVSQDDRILTCIC